MAALAVGVEVALLIGAGMVWLAVLPVLVDRWLRSAGMTRANFQGRSIPAGYGLIIVLWAIPASLALISTGTGDIAETRSAMWVVFGYGLLGFLDDRFGNRSESGIRGHLKALFRGGRVTTGLIKAGGGLAVGAAVAALILERHGWEALLDGAVIALSANALNLLDVRPGRACAAFLLVAAPFVLVGAAGGHLSPLVVTVIPALAVYPADARARAMLGDTGSNPLGAVLGLSLVTMEGGIEPRVAALVLLLALHAVAERWSITALIERSAVLRRLDSLTGVRGAAANGRKEKSV